MIGRTIGHYQILDKLGEGGMGVVYKARDTHLDRFVAVKVLPPEKVADPERKRRFVQEAKAASALNHPNIIHIYDISSQGGVDFIAMEYVAGKTLERLTPRKGMGVSEALKYAVQIADALSKAHSACIVDRDLKPGNVMVTNDGLVKVLDFGLAKLTETAPAGEDQPTRTLQPQTEEGTIVGTVAYMSPEQAQGKPVDARSDIFSYGSVLYEMVTGRRAFQGDSKMSTLAAIMKEEPKPVRALADEIPSELERIITRCLRKDPARRFQHMEDLAVALEELEEESDSGKLATAPVAVSRHARRLPRIAQAGGLLAVLAAVLAWHYLRPKPAAPMKAVPLTTYPGREAGPTFSPDGSQVAFSWNGEKQDNFDIYVRPVDGGAPMRITTAPAHDASPAWSPDGSSIAFFRLLPQGRAAAIVIPALGGPERKLTEVYMSISDLALGARLTWSPDSRQLVIVDRNAPGEPTGLFLLSLVSKEKRRLISPPAKSVGDSYPALSPDGRALAFCRSPGYVLSDLYVLSLSENFTPKGEPTRLTFDKRQVRGPAWTPDGHQIVFASNRLGSFSLWRVSPSAPGRLEQLPSLGQDVVSPAISPRGPSGVRLAYVHSPANRDIWRVGRSDPAGKTAPPVKFIASTRDDVRPAFSPDGKKIAFTSNRSGSYEIWVCQSDGLNAVRLTSFAGPVTDGSAWSPDGRWIAFHSRPEGQAEIYVVSSEGGAPRKLTNDPAEDIWPGWSRDGKWIYFGSNRTGEHQVWKMPAEGGPALQVTRNGGMVAVESPDGKYLYYTKVRGITSLWRMPADGGGAETRILESLFYLSFTVRPEGIYYIPREGAAAETSIHFFSFITGTSRPTLKLQRGDREYLAVSPDGQTLLYVEADPSGSDLMLVENLR